MKIQNESIVELQEQIRVLQLENAALIASNQDAVSRNKPIAGRDQWEDVQVASQDAEISKLKPPVEGIRNSTELFREVLEYSIDALYKWDLKTNCLEYLSPAFTDISGYTPGEMCSLSVYEVMKLIHPDDRDEVMRNMDSALSLSAGQNGTVEYRFRHKDGKHIWLFNKFNIIRKEGEPVALFGSISDHSRQKLAEQKLVESETLFRTLSSTELVGVYILMNGKMTYVNPALAGIFGYTVEELTGASPLLVIHPDNYALVTENIRRRVDGEVEQLQYEFLGLCKNGESRNIEVRGVRVSLNNEIAIIGNILDITEQKHQEYEIKKYQNHLETLVEQRTREIALLSQLVYVSLESASVGAWWIDFKEDDTYHALDTTANMIGVPVSRLPQKAYRISDWLDLMLETRKRAPEYTVELDNAIEQFKGTISGKYEKLRVVYPVVLPGQSVKWIDARADVSSRDQEKRALLMTGTVIDVTSLIAAEKELKAHKIHLEGLVAKRTRELEQRNHDLQMVTERLSLATRAAKIGIWDWNIVKNELVWDSTMYELYGIRRDDFGGAYEAWSHTIHPEDKAYTDAEIQAALRGEREYAPEFRVVWPDGSLHHIQASSLTFHTPDGKPSRMVGINYDVTAQKQAQNAREESELRFRAFVEQAPVAIGVFNLNGLGVYANQKFIEILGLNGLDDMIGRPAYEYFIPEFREASKERIRLRMMGLDVPQVFDSVALRSDGSEFPVQLAVAPIQLASGANSIAFLFDLTSIKQVEGDLIKAKERAEESDRLKTAFLANMSHEIRTPMNGILGFSELLKEPGLSGEEQQRYIEMIEKGGTRMLNIINNILSISKVEAGQMEITLSQFSIDEQMDYVFKFFHPEAERKNLLLTLRKPSLSKDYILKTDQEKVYAILANLVNNAIKYTQAGSIEFGYEKKGNFLEFFVKDTGIGIPSYRQQAVFERFIQSDGLNPSPNQGAGLGLSISKAYVEMLGGRIWVESNFMKGSTFYFTIPC